MRDKVYIGAEAERLLDSQIFKEASQAVRDGIIGQMGKVGIKDTEMHTKLVLTLQLWEGLERHIKAIATTGKIEQYQLEQEAKQSKIREMFRF